MGKRKKRRADHISEEIEKLPPGRTFRLWGLEDEEEHLLALCLNNKIAGSYRSQGRASGISEVWAVKGEDGKVYALAPEHCAEKGNGPRPIPLLRQNLETALSDAAAKLTPEEQLTLRLSGGRH